MPDHVFLDPDGTQDLGMFVVVERETGVRYAHQCGGYATDRREIEGFLVPVGGPNAALPLIEFFRRTCGGNPPSSDSPHRQEYYTDAVIAELRALVAMIPCWVTTPPDEDNREHLALDEERLMELTEAWVPVVTPMGRGVLLFENCD